MWKSLIHVIRVIIQTQLKETLITTKSRTMKNQAISVNNVTLKQEHKLVYRIILIQSMKDVVFHAIRVTLKLHENHHSEDMLA